MVTDLAWRGSSGGGETATLEPMAAEEAVLPDDVTAEAQNAPPPTEQRRRTIDVTTGAASFDELLLPGWLLRGLAAGGFARPSPVQTAAIPIGRMGADLVVQAKSGTGKTLVFGIICLDKIRTEVAMPQAVILAPTHEIALQSAEVLGQLSAHMPAPGAAIGVFIGGLPISEDQKLLRRRCQIAVGTPGRICRLLEIGALLPKQLTILVLDEADHLMSDSFIRDIRYVAKEVLPKRKQVLALSATYSPALLAELDGLMSEPHHVMLCPETVSLLGVKQFFVELSEELDDDELLEAKVQQLLRVLSTTTFHQALVFYNGMEGQGLADRLCALGYPAAYVSGAHAQVDRMDTIAAVHDFRVRVIVATDLASRGLDMANVNLVANLDLPYDAATCMHRVGRTGRFGTHGVAIAFATQPELQRLRSFLQDAGGGQIEPLPDTIPEELYASHGGDAAAPSAPAAWQQQSVSAIHELDADQQPEAGDAEASCSSSQPANGHWDLSALGGDVQSRAQPVWTRGEGSLSSDADAALGEEPHFYGKDDAAYDDTASDDGAHDEEEEEAFSEVSASFDGDAYKEGNLREVNGAANSASHSQLAGASAAGIPAVIAATGSQPHSSGAAAAILGTSLWAAPPPRLQGSASMQPAVLGVQDAEPDPWAARQHAQQRAQQPAEGADPALGQAHAAAGPDASVGWQMPLPGAEPALQPPEPPAASAAAVGGTAAADCSEGQRGIAVSPDLLVRYYQLEAFAAEYYTWFCRTQQQDSPAG